MAAPSDSGIIGGYVNEFSGGDPANLSEYPKDTRIAKAYEISLDIRKFEIELYWKRAGYFWLLIAALATTLGVVLTAGSDGVMAAARRETIGLFISCAGTVTGLCWMLVNRASKGWQRNWELQVDVLEDAALGPLYKTVMYKGADGEHPLHFSVSDANFWISCYFMLMFFACAVYFSGVGRFRDVDTGRAIIVGANFAFVLWFFAKSRAVEKRSDLRVPISFTRRETVGGRKITADSPPPSSP
jgi:hypothetical protein